MKYVVEQEQAYRYFLSMSLGRETPIAATWTKEVLPVSGKPGAVTSTAPG